MTEKRVTVWVQRFKDRTHLVLQWLDPETRSRKSKSAGTDNTREAERKRADLEYELNHGKGEASRTSWARFREAFEAEYVVNLREGTREHYRQTLDLFESLVNPGGLRSISERTVSRFLGAMKKKPTHGREGLAASTVKGHIQFLRTSLNWAVKQKLIPRCPEFPRVKVPRRKPKQIRSEDFGAMLAVAPDDNMKAFLPCGWLAGLRLAEAHALEWNTTSKAPYLDLAKDRIILPAAKVKADEDQWLPLDPDLREALETLPRKDKKVFHFLAPDGHEICTAAVSRKIVRLGERAGVKLTMHTLRKGFGCRYAGEVSAQVLQRLMRHSSIKVTMDYYANIDQAVEDAVMGSKRNKIRNSEDKAEESERGENDVSPYKSGLNDV